MPRLNDDDWKKGRKMEFRFNQKFLPDFTPPQKIIAEQFARRVADILFQQLSDDGEKIVSISHDLKEEPGGAKYEGKIIIEDIVRCKDCKYSEHWRRDERMCSLWDDAWVFDDGFCNHAERRTDERSD